MTGSGWGGVLGLLAVLAAGPTAARADDEAGTTVEQRLNDLEERNRAIEERLEKSEARNSELERTLAERDAERSRLLQGEIDDYLQATASSDGGDRGLPTSKGAWLKFYGFLRLDLYYDTARASNVIVPTTVFAEDGVAAAPNDDQFAFDARLTRLGFLFDFGALGSSAVTGKLETDFANFPQGSPESRETPRIRLAYIQIENDQWRLRLGQDWDVVSPLYPTPNSETLMWNAGNPGDRRPMIAWTWKARKGVVVTVAVGLTGAINNLDLDAGLGTYTSTERDGFDSGLPHVQVRAGLTRDSWAEGKSWTVGVWGFAGRLETDTRFAGEDHFTSWMAGVDLTLPLTGKLELRGEGWYGQALGDIRGNIGQTINTATGEEIRGWGGWLELRYKHDDRWLFHLGGSMDDPTDSRLAAGAPTLNFTLYTGLRRQWNAKLVSGFDVIFWETQYEGAGLGNMVRFNFFTSVDF